MPRRWTKTEENSLFLGAGVYGLDWFKKRSGGRSTDAVHSKAQRNLGHGGLSRGSYSLKEICDRTGYSRTALYRAREALAQKWKRTSSRGSYLIYEDQVTELMEWLKHDYWAKKHRLYVCLWCASDHHLHASQGLCKRCWGQYYKRMLRAGFPVKTGELLQFFKDKPFPEIVEHLERGRALLYKHLKLLGVW